MASWPTKERAAAIPTLQSQPSPAYIKQWTSWPTTIGSNIIKLHMSWRWILKRACIMSIWAIETTKIEPVKMISHYLSKDMEAEGSCTLTRLLVLLKSTRVYWIVRSWTKICLAWRRTRRQLNSNRRRSSFTRESLWRLPSSIRCLLWDLAVPASSRPRPSWSQRLWGSHHIYEDIPITIKICQTWMKSWMKQSSKKMKATSLWTSIRKKEMIMIAEQSTDRLTRQHSH